MNYELLAVFMIISCMEYLEPEGLKGNEMENVIRVQKSSQWVKSSDAAADWRDCERVTHLWIV